MTYELIDPNEPILQEVLPDITFEELKEKFGLEPKELFDNLGEAMTKYKGIGLSANQCGLPIRAFVMMTDLDKKAATIFFNPKITNTSEETELFVEGCLTYPNLFLNIRRPKQISFEFMDVNGEQRQAQFSGITARIFQHEYDHLQGINFTDRVSKLRLDMAKKKQKKLFKKYKVDIKW